MRNQPVQPATVRAPGKPARSWAAANFGGALSCGAWFAVPAHANALAVLPAATDAIFPAALAVLTGVLGVSASLLYRHMHHREEELSRRADTAEAELRALLMMTDEAVLVLSADGKVRAANPAAEELFGLAGEEFVGEPLTRIIAQPLSLGELTRHGPVNFETTAKRGGGEFVRVEMLLSPVENAGGKGYLALLHGTRATLPGEPKNAASGKPNLEKEIGKFTHDLNNHLTAVLGNLSLILMAKPGDPANHARVLSAKKTAVGAQVLSQKFQSLVRAEDDEESAPQAAAEQSMPTCTILPMPAINPPSRKPTLGHSGPSRILILDDEEAICLLVASALDASGFEVTPAMNVASALAACEEAVASGAPFSLVICDLSLPGDTDGIQALRKLRALDPDILAIVSSGYDSDPVMRDCRRHGFNAAMAKPYDISKLVRTVGEVLHGDSAALLKTA